MPFVAALSAHPLAAHAAGEVVGEVLERLAGPVDVAVLLVSGAHGRQFEQIASVVQATLSPSCLVGATTIGVLAGERAAVDSPAIALWAGTGVDATAVRLDATGPASEPVVAGLDPDLAEHTSALLLLATPSFPIDAALVELGWRHPALLVAGGVVAAGVRPSDTKLLWDGSVSSTGAVGLALGPREPVHALVSQPYRPIGVPLVVTGTDGPVVRELAGRPILDRLDEILLELDDATAAAATRGLHLGQVVDEHQASFGPGDFAVRPVTDVDRVGRTLTVAAPIEVGATIQFLVQDGLGADQDLRAQLAGHRASGALCFVSAERGPLLDVPPDHDAELISAVVDRQATVGAVCTSVLTSFSLPLVDQGATAVVVLVGGDP